MLSQKKHLEVANTCYANVAGRFAMFCNPLNRGPNFTWENFITRCTKDAPLWIQLHDIRGDKKALNKLAMQYAEEIASTLVRNLQT